MKKLTATEKTLERLRARRAKRLAEVAMIERMISAAEGTAPRTTTITVSPFIPAPSVAPPAPVFYPVLPPVQPYYPQPGIVPNWGPALPAFPFGEVFCGGTLPVEMGGQVFARTSLDACGGIPMSYPTIGVFTHNAPVTIASGSN